MGFKIFIPQETAPAGKDYLKELGYEIKMGTGISEEELIRDVADCDAVMLRTAKFTEKVIAAGKKLKLIARQGAGYDNVDLKAAADRGVWVTNAPLSTVTSVAEQSFCLLLATARNLLQNNRQLIDGNWEVRNQLTGIELEGKVLGIIGAGRIGTKVAQMATHGFGMKVIAYDPMADAAKIDPCIELINDWDEVFKTADVISLHVPSTPQTIGSVAKKEFQMMKKSAFLVNCARGNVINEADLIEALKNKDIRGAGLDVFEQEPPQTDNELFTLDNVVLTPHNSSHTEECKDRMVLHAAYEIERVLSGQAPFWPVNKPVFE